MQTLDLRTIILLTGFMGAMMALVLVFLHGTSLRSVSGLREWAAAALLGTCAAIFLGVRDILPDFLTIVIGNLLLIGGVSLFSIGTRRFFDMDAKLPLFVGIVAAMSLPLAWYAVVEPNYGLRLQMVSGLLALIFGEHAWLMYRRGSGSFAFRFTMATLLVQAAVLASRALSAGSVPAAAELLSPSPMQSVYIASYAVGMLALSIGVILLATERLREELEYLATHDVMTGTLNRRAFIETAERELERCRRHGHVMSLLMMDLDHFKNVNDTYGHLVGDRVLKDFASRVISLLRLPDQFGRYGGEEFVLLLPETGREAAAIVADRICKATADAKAPACTVSIGLATTTLIDTSIGTLLSRADEALYRAKSGGRNQVAMAPLLQEVTGPVPDATLRPGPRPAANRRS